MDTNGLDAASVSQKQAASKPLPFNKLILCDRNVFVKSRLSYCDPVASPVALFVSGHPYVHQQGPDQLHFACRQILCAMVGPLSNLDWSRRWREIFMLGMVSRNQSHWNIV